MSLHERARRIADYIPDGAIVLDVHGGETGLEHALPAGCTRIPCQLINGDFGAGMYPEVRSVGAEIVSVFDVLEHLADPRELLSHVRQWALPVVISYRTGHDDLHALANLLLDVGFSIQRTDRIDDLHSIIKLQPASPVLPPVKTVGVLSFYHWGNFGDRLGYHLINDALPAHAEVTHIPWWPWECADSSFDLLVVGIGNSLYHGVINNDLLALVDRCGVSIGIFGTQIPSMPIGPELRTLVGRLHHWYARYEEDLFRYGRGLTNASHLGDWLITAFPMARPTTSDRLDIDEDTFTNSPLDHTIQWIQRHGTVFSSKLHPLLCALTSAERVGYREQEHLPGIFAGKIRSMLMDVFGRAFPEEELWAVDRERVRAYKQTVQVRTLELRRRLRHLLETRD